MRAEQDINDLVGMDAVSAAFEITGQLFEVLMGTPLNDRLLISFQ